MSNVDKTQSVGTESKRWKATKSTDCSLHARKHAPDKQKWKRRFAEFLNMENRKIWNKRKTCTGFMDLPDFSNRSQN